MFNEIYEIVKKIPIGKVASYGEVARAIGRPKCARQVGWALHQNPSQREIPCHRVVRKDGRLAEGFAFGGMECQKALLETEGVKVSDDFFVDKSYFCNFEIYNKN